MKNLTAKYLSLMMLASLLYGTAQASRDDGFMDGGECCSGFWNKYECGCNPLYCGAWDLQFQGGTNPITWRHNGPLLGVNCANSATLPVIPILDESPAFNKLFTVPWTVGGQVGYHLTDNARIFVEFYYVQATAKKEPTSFASALNLPVTGALTFAFDKYQMFEGYFGARYYWDRWCDRISFFAGAKIGFIYRLKDQNLTLTATFPTTVTAITNTIQPFYKKSTRIAGGGHLGLDYCICGNWSIVLTGEVVAMCGPHGVGNVPLTNKFPAAPAAQFTNILTPNVTELQFPVTGAIRYSF